MNYKAVGKEEPTSMMGLNLNGLNACKRQVIFDEWAEAYCDYYPSLTEAEKHLPFPVKFPESPMVSNLSGIYVLKMPADMADTIICHFENAVNGITLTILHNAADLSEKAEHDWTVFERTENSPLAISCLVGDLQYFLSDGWENLHSLEELEEMLKSLI